MLLMLGFAKVIVEYYYSHHEIYFGFTYRIKGIQISLNLTTIATITTRVTYQVTFE